MTKSGRCHTQLANMSFDEINLTAEEYLQVFIARFGGSAPSAIFSTGPDT